MCLEVINKPLSVKGSEASIRFLDEGHGGQFTRDNQVMNLIKFTGGELARVQQGDPLDHERGHLFRRQLGKVCVPVGGGRGIVERGTFACRFDLSDSGLSSARVNVLVRVLDQVNQGVGRRFADLEESCPDQVFKEIHPGKQH